MAAGPLESDPTLTPARYIMAVKIYKSSGCPIIRREACMYVFEEVEGDLSVLHLPKLQLLAGD